jgi:two-component system OmpR family response regulator
LLHAGDVEIDLAARRARRGSTDVPLTRREWAIVGLLAQRPGANVSKARIEEALYDFDTEIESNTVEVHISRLRKKLGRDTIHTERGVGYRLETA